jgi:hypothetical protein
MSMVVSICSYESANRSKNDQKQRGQGTKNRDWQQLGFRDKDKDI